MDAENQKKDALEKAHRTNVERLVEEFGPERQNEIEKTYRTVRESDEKKAKIKDFLPIFTYRAARDALSGSRSEEGPTQATANP